MLDLGLQEAVRHVQRAVRASGEVFRAALHRLAQDRAGDLKHRQRIRVGIGVENIPAAHGLREARRVVGKARDRKLRAARGKLHRVEEVRERGALCRHAQRRIRCHRRFQVAHHLIEPFLRAALQIGKLREPVCPALAVRADRFAGKALFAAGHDSLHAQKLLSLVGRLHDERAAHRLPGDGHMLVPGQQNIEIQLPADAVGDVLVSRGEHAPRGKVALKAAVVDAHRQVDLPPQLFQCGGRGGDGVGDRNAGKMLRLFPDVHIVGHDADDADPQSVFQCVDARGKAQPRPVPAHVFTHAAGLQRIEIAVKVRHSIVEVVVAERYIIIAAAVHHVGKARGAADGIVAEGPQRRALQDVAAVDDEGVAVLAEAAGALEEPQLLFLAAAVVGGVDVAVQVGGEVNGQLFFVHTLPPCQLDADLCRDPLDDEHQHDQPQQDRADLVPAIRVHGEDQRRADAARAHKAEHGRVAQVHVEAVDDRGDEVRRQLRQDAVADLLEGGAARGVQRFQNSLVEILDALDEHLRHHADRAERHRQKARKRAGAGDTDEHQAVDERGDGADAGDEHAADERHALRHQIARRQKRQRQRDHRAHDRAEERNAERFQQQVRHAVRAEGKQQLCRGMENAGEDVPRHLQSVAGGVADLHRRAGPGEKAGDDKGRQQLPHPCFRCGGVGFFDSFVHCPFPLTSGACAARG